MSNESSFWSGNAKTMFYMGLILGVACSAIVALVLIGYLLFSGKTFAAALRPSANAAVQPANTDPTANAAPTPAAQPVAAVTASDHVEGAKNAKVTLIEYADFECPFCKNFQPTIQQALTDFPNDVRLVYRHFPLSSIHQNAEISAEAAECATKLGGEKAFWQFHDKLFAQSPDLSEPSLLTAATSIGLSSSAMKSCIDSGEMKNVVANDYASGNDAGVQGTPATFVNGTLISGALPYTNLKAAITAAGGKN